jgi:hypothetical protein
MIAGSASARKPPPPRASRAAFRCGDDRRLLGRHRNEDVAPVHPVERHTERQSVDADGVLGEPLCRREGERRLAREARGFLRRQRGELGHLLLTLRHRQAVAGDPMWARCSRSPPSGERHAAPCREPRADHDRLDAGRPAAGSRSAASRRGAPDEGATKARAPRCPPRDRPGRPGAPPRRATRRARSPWRRRDRSGCPRSRPRRARGRGAGGGSPRSECPSRGRSRRRARRRAREAPRSASRRSLRHRRRRCS